MNNTSWQHGQPQNIGIILFNLGTPNAPTPKAVKTYLAEFLSDPRVIELPRWLWKIILHGIILQVRPKKSAKKYSSIWQVDGSPLNSWTIQQTKLLQENLTKQGLNAKVDYAMRYGEPSITHAWQRLQDARCSRILILPLYPQYCAATTASGFDVISQCIQTMRNIPELRFIKHYHDHPTYIEACCTRIRESLQASHEQIDHLVLNFHGMPERTLHLGDPYFCECQKTARLILEQLNWPITKASVTFQSRFGKAKWLEPSTQNTVLQLAKDKKRIAIFCPGFVSDCLETLEEINQELREDYTHAGGKTFHYIPCLNDHPVWLATLTELVVQHTQGWPIHVLNEHAQMQHTQDLRQSQSLALQLGAKQ